MKKFLPIMLGLGLLLTTVPPSFGKSSTTRKHKKTRKTSHKSSTRGNTAK